VTVDDPRDLAQELRFALAEGDAVDPPDGLRARVLAAATEARAAGPAVDPPEHITGLEVFRRVVARIDALLTSFDPDEWSCPSARYRSVQNMVGHLVGVEEAFLAVLGGGADPVIGSEHAAMTEDAQRRQADRPALDTRREWFERASASIAALEAMDLDAPIAFYGATFTLDELLVIRAFELWIHDEDLRRATRRSLEAPDAETLARMVQTAVALLPAGVALSGRDVGATAARLVLTGPGGGTWDVNLDGGDVARPADARVVVDAAWFCRIVGNREDATTAGAVITGTPEVARDLLVGAAALAFD
jgi:uncharacterized protein (TIGR03083 family)